jgi:hypothetical protein
MMLNCKEITQMCSEEMERHLSVREKMALGTHLMMCTGCSNFRKQMGTLREVSKLYAQGQAISTPEPPSVPDQN